ncbi:endo-1,4-beta-xylanase [Qipengyuania sp. GH1]|uniref:endo-1,4-beta-xylanase n=1 Tax=Qipengyuania aestuarii TaxID=2867241 RepID=UPI001C877D3E|nr:endo-1,4-beta-xylanase [Qipengyuania aestuarii]MBX7534956.1 endo-1,4-beta-xylanase [Qipengyuania aestuarii]
MPRDLRLTRRDALTGLAAIPLAGCASSYAGRSVLEPGAGSANGSPYPKPSLDQLARKNGRRFGSAVASTPGRTDQGSIQNARYMKLIKAECGIVVPENEMKWQTIRPGPDAFDFSRMDSITAWAKQNDMALRGHTLLWHRPQWFPDWLNTYDFGANPVAEAEKLLTDHIRAVTRRYRGQIQSYDVVNEAIDHDRNAPIETSLSRAMGSPEAVIDLAFHTAREELPDAQLVYNDYMSWEPDHRKHCDDVLRLLEGMVKRGTPVDALGIQSHIEIFAIDPATGVGPYLEREWRRFLDEVTGMGLRLLITEFDVKDRALPANVRERDQKVAEFSRRYFDLMLEYGDHLDDILAWGMTDTFNWLQYFEPAERPDGLQVRGTPYSSDYEVKPLRTAIAEQLDF